MESRRLRSLRSLGWSPSFLTPRLSHASPLHTVVRVPDLCGLTVALFHLQ
jgi:hypothetical protein